MGSAEDENEDAPDPRRTPRLLPHATSVHVARDGSRHVVLLLAKSPTDEQLAELRDYVGETGTIQWSVCQD